MQQSWLRVAVTRRHYRATCQAAREGERQSNPMNGQLFMRREQKMKAGGGERRASVDPSNPDFIIAVL